MRSTFAYRLPARPRRDRGPLSRGLATAAIGLAANLAVILLFQGNLGAAFGTALFLGPLAGALVGALLRSPLGVLTWPISAAFAAAVIHPSGVDWEFLNVVHYSAAEYARGMAFVALPPTIAGLIASLIAWRRAK